MLIPSLFHKVEMEGRMRGLQLDYRSFPGGSDGKKSVCNGRDLGWIPGWRRSPGEGKGYPLQYSGLDNGVAKSQTRPRLSVSSEKRMNICICVT